jgi:hypothetical protein
MKLIKIATAAFAAIFAFTSCVGDLNVTPIDPSVTLPEDVLNSEDAYARLLAKCYQGLCVSGSDGANGGPDIDGIDGGFGQYMRAMFYMNEYTTDEASCPWNDQTVANLHGLSWTPSDVFVTAMFSRIYYQIQICNEFIRRASASQFADSQTMKTYIAEARALRALSYYHAIDMFGNVPFATEANSVGSTGPDQISRGDLFEWIDDECKNLIDGGQLMKKSNVYGRLDENFVKMVRAHLNLNARVYLGLANDAAAKQYYDVVGTLCNEIMAAYPNLHPNWAELFQADNHSATDEIIFAVQSDPTDTQTYGNTEFLIMASFPGGDTAISNYLGVPDGGWGGINVMPQFIDKFDDADVRKCFWGPKGSKDASTSPYSLLDYKDFKSGWSAYKFTNRYKDGTFPAVKDFPETDFPLLRSADAYLMLAEANLRGSDKATKAAGMAAWNAVRARAGLPALAAADYTLDNLIDERGRELYWECWRRSDLIRFDLFTTGDYLWAWKGGVYEGRAVDKKFNLMPIPAAEVNSNSKLSQNEGY